MQAAPLSTLLIRTPWNRQGTPRALFVSSYPPRECGIATFTEDVKNAYDELAGVKSDVIAVTDPDATYDYSSCVVGQIQRDDPASYVAAARLANDHPADVINIQHEYGLFGGERGAMLIQFLQNLRKPVVLTFHTTLPDPEPALAHVTRELCNRADRVIVLSYEGRRLLETVYGIDGRKVNVVLHGAPDVPFRQSRHFKKQLQLGDHTLLATFGLINRGKGIEYVLDALPVVFDRHPNAMYLLLGETHPVVRRYEGEVYRESLIKRVEELGIADRVRFVDHYLSDGEIVSYLLATDVYLSPSLDPNQIVSGTLSYAVACGRVVIATEYLYARELLDDHRGITVPFRDSGALAAAINLVLDDPDLRSTIELSAYRYGRQMTWPRVARAYHQVFADVVRREAEAAGRSTSTPSEKAWNAALRRQAAHMVPSVPDGSPGGN